MKKIYERPEIVTLEVKKEDIITNSYMLPEMFFADTSEDVDGETNGQTLS